MRVGFKRTSAALAPENVEAAMESLKATGEEVVVVGKTVAGKGVILK